MKKISIKIILFFIFCIFIISTKTIAATTYFYWYMDGNNKVEMGNINTGYSTIALCDIALKKQIQLGYTTSPTCYAGDTVAATGISPTSGKAGDTVTINGSNFYGVTSLSFPGGATLKNTDLVVTPTSILITSLPSGITTGTITINTTFRGTTQTPIFTVSAANSNLPWWFTIETGEVKGLPNGYTQALCIANRDNYLKMFPGVNSAYVSACFQDTVANAQLIKKTNANAPIGGYVGVDAVNSSTNSSKYTLLAPLPGLKPCLDWNTDPNKKDPSCMGANIGEYLNIIFKLLIGICAALAVIMLIINGILYMGEESVFGKVEAKSKMISAIFGLIIALGAWALLNTLNPALTGKGGFTISSAKTDITPLYDRGINDPKNAAGESIRCTPVTNPSSPCTVANLTPVFGADNAVAMSKICNMESGGNSIASGTDVCKPGNTAFSFGLFQINLSANGSLAGPECVGIFDKAVTGADAIIPKYNSGFSCALLSGKDALYNTCKAKLLDPTTNLAIAKSLFTASKSAWKGDKAACASAFQ